MADEPDQTEEIDPEPVGAPSDEVKALPNGQIRLMVSGQLYLLRIPNIGEIKRYRLSLLDMLKRVEELSQATASSVDAARAGDASVYESLREELGSDERAEVEALICDLFRTIVNDLDVADRKLPDDNDAMPPWAANIGLLVQFVQHWRRVPRGPGR